MIASSRICFIVKTLGICEKPAYSIIMEYIEGPTLHGFLSSKEPMTWKTCYQFCLDITKGMEFLHKRGIIHGDVKTQNILLTNDNRAKIADFGGAKLLRSSLNSSSPSNSGTLLGKQVAGTLHMLAPELLAGAEITGISITGFEDGIRTTKYSDMYSYGLILIEITTRKSPFYTELSSVRFGQLDMKDLIKQICNQTIQPTQNLTTPTDLTSIINRCLIANPRERINITDALNQLEVDSLKLPKSLAEVLIK